MNKEESLRIIFFDGVCNLCNGAVSFIIHHDKNDVFKLASLQSEVADEILKKYNMSSQLDTFIYLRYGTVYKRSSAALYVLYDMGFPLRLFSILLILPSFLRDPFYRLISRYRYKLFGKRDSCLLPTDDIKHKFLDS